MARLLSVATLLALLHSPLRLGAQYQTIELADVQLAKSVSGVVEDPSGYPRSDVLVQEFSSDWKTVLRTSRTKANGRFSLPTVQGRKIYCLQLSEPGFDPLRVRIQVDRKHGTSLKLKLTIGT